MNRIQSVTTLGCGLLLLSKLAIHAGPGTSAIPLPVPTTGHSGFTIIPPATSGVHFNNLLPALAAGQNQNLMNGSGVAAGDFDGDGRCDLYFCAINGTNALYRNLGNWRFEEMAVSAGVACPHWVSTGAVFADIDGDGDLDLLVSTLGTGVHCFRNDGHGHFQENTAEAGLTSSAAESWAGVTPGRLTRSSGCVEQTNGSSMKPTARYCARLGWSAERSGVT